MLRVTQGILFIVLYISNADIKVNTNNIAKFPKYSDNNKHLNPMILWCSVMQLVENKSTTVQGSSIIHDFPFLLSLNKSIKFFKGEVETEKTG